MDKEEELFQKIRELEEEYLKAKTGRKQIQAEIINCIEKLRKDTKKNNNELYQKEINYQYRNHYISDYNLVMNVILKLANRNRDIYAMKNITTTDFVSFDNKETKQIYGHILVFASKEILGTISEDRLLYYDEFSYMASRIINNGNSMIIIAPNYFEGNVKPKDYASKVLRVDLKNGGIMGNVSCYLQDEELEEIIYKIIDYIDINGCDFQNIDEDTLCDLIISEEKKKEYGKR